MASFYDKLRIAESQSCVSPIVAKLRGIFDSIDDEELLTTIKGKVHRGCQGYDVKALWRSYVISYVENIPTVRGLIRALENNHDLCKASGINPLAIPHESTYSRFVAKLAKHQELVKRTIDKAVAELQANLDDFGKVVAIDSTDVRAYSQGTRKNSTRIASDPDARWGAKNKHGGKYFWFGYKVHMVCDAVYELPINVEVTPASVSDYQTYIPPLRNANIRPDFVLADAGYDASYNYGFTVDELGAIPVIDRNKRRGDGRPDRIPKRTKEQIRNLELRQFPGLDRDSREWKRLYDKRVSVERLFSRMKEFRRLSSVHHRGIEKVTLHAYLSTLTIVASAVDAIYSNYSLRKVA